VASSLRHVIEDFTPATDRDNGVRLKQWIDPLVADSGIEVIVEDERTTPSGLAEAQAAFVLVYQAVRAVRDSTLRRTLHVNITDEDGGERIVVTLPSRPPAELTGSRATRFRAIAHHTQGLGGTLTHWLDPDHVRTLSMWIPKLTHPRDRSATPTAKPAMIPRARARNDVSFLPPLSDSAWNHLVSEAPEYVAEFNDRMRVSLASAMLIDASPADLLGLNVMSILQMANLDQIDDISDRLEAGEFIDTHWYRTDDSGHRRLVRVTLSPRIAPDGRWAGLFAAAEDRTDIELLDGLYETALTDLTLARHIAIEASIRRLEEPLAECKQLIDHLGRHSSPGPDGINTIRLALEDALQAIKNSSSAFTAPPASIGDLEAVLRESLGMLLEGRRLVVVDHTDSAPTPESYEVVFRVIREAVSNAVLHGGAETITITLLSTDAGISCVIHDDGIGVRAEDLDQQPGHLGTRAMQARARERGGTCRIGPHPIVGTVVELWLPSDPGRHSLSDGFSWSR